MHDDVKNVWKIVAAIVILVVVFITVFTKVINTGKTAPTQVDTLYQQTEDLKN